MSVWISLHVLVLVQMVQTAMPYELGVQILLPQPLFHHLPQHQCLPRQAYLLQEQQRRHPLKAQQSLLHQQLLLRPRQELLYLPLRQSLLQLLNLLALLRQPYH